MDVSPCANLRVGRRSILGSLVAVLAACSPPTALVEPAIAGPSAPLVEVRPHDIVWAPEPATARPLAFAVELIAVDPDMGPFVTPGGPWSPGTASDVLFSSTFMVVDEDALWGELGAMLLRIPRGSDRRWVRAVPGCSGWLIGERDDLLWCAEQRDASIEITALDKFGFGPPSPAATLPFAEALRTSLHPRVEALGPLIVGDHVVLATETGFVSAELEGDGPVQFIETGHQPNCVVTDGERLAWRDFSGGALYSGELPLSKIRREYVGEDLVGCPALAGGSLLFRVKVEGLELRRVRADGQMLSLERAPAGLDALVSDGERAWWLVRDRGVWWIDATSHGAIDGRGIVPFEATADGGLFAWWASDAQGRSIRAGELVSEPRGDPTTSVDLRVRPDRRSP